MREYEITFAQPLSVNCDEVSIKVGCGVERVSENDSATDSVGIEFLGPFPVACSSFYSLIT